MAAWNALGTEELEIVIGIGEPSKGIAVWWKSWLIWRTMGFCFSSCKGAWAGDLAGDFSIQPSCLV